MDAFGVLAFGEAAKEIHQLMRFSLTLRVSKRTVDQFLQHEVPTWILRQIGGGKDGFKIRYVPMHVPGDNQFRAALKFEPVPLSPGRGRYQFRGPADGRE
ncbi:MAG: hypothetical protein U0798_08915 [Gemmataceae bacterium]